MALQWGELRAAFLERNGQHIQASEARGYARRWRRLLEDAA